MVAKHKSTKEAVSHALRNVVPPHIRRGKIIKDSKTAEVFLKAQSLHLKKPDARLRILEGFLEHSVGEAKQFFLEKIAQELVRQGKKSGVSGRAKLN